MAVRTWIEGWPVYRQVIGADPFARGAAVGSGRSMSCGHGRPCGWLTCMAAYTAVLIGDTAVPAWHEGYPEMPFVFTGSAAMAAGGLGLLAAPPDESGPARHLALFGQVMEMLAFERMTHRIGMAAEPYHTGRGGAYIKAGQVLGAVGATGAALSGTPLVPARLRRIVTAGAGAALMAASAATGFGVFHAGMASARDPKYAVVPQRERLARRGTARMDAEAMAAAPAPAPAVHAVPPA